MESTHECCTILNNWHDKATLVQNRALFEQAIFYSSDWQGLNLDKYFL